VSAGSWYSGTGDDTVESNVVRCLGLSSGLSSSCLSPLGRYCRSWLALHPNPVDRGWAYWSDALLGSLASGSCSSDDGRYGDRWYGLGALPGSAFALAGSAPASHASYHRLLTPRVVSMSNSTLPTTSPGPNAGTPTGEDRLEKADPNEAERCEPARVWMKEREADERIDWREDWRRLGCEP